MSLYTKYEYVSRTDDLYPIYSAPLHCCLPLCGVSSDFQTISFLLSASLSVSAPLLGKIHHSQVVQQEGCVTVQ